MSKAKWGGLSPNLARAAQGTAEQGATAEEISDLFSVHLDWVEKNIKFAKPAAPKKPAAKKKTTKGAPTAGATVTSK